MALDPGLLAQIANPPNPIDNYTRLMALGNMRGQQQLQQQQIQQGQQQLNGQQALDQAMSQAFTKGPDGNLLINRDAVTSTLNNRGMGHLIPGVLKNFEEMDKAAAETSKLKTEAKTASDNYTANSLLTIHDADYDPSIAIGTIAHAREVGLIPPDQAKQMADQITANPTKETVKGLIDPILSRSPDIQKLFDARKTSQAAADTAAARATTAATGKEKETAELPGIKADAVQKQVDAAAPQLEAAFKQGGPQAVSDLLDTMPRGVAKRFEGATKQGDFTQAALTPVQATQAGQAKIQEEQAKTNAAETKRHNQAEEANASRNTRINVDKFKMEFGGDAVKAWAKQVAQNPDTEGEVPPNLRTSVMTQFTADTGLPFPKPLAGTAVDQERAARNTLDKIPRIQELLADPEIQSRIGPIMGRLGNAEQSVGSAVGLSPRGEQRAQELRTIMRYMVFGEGKAVLGGRLPKELMQALETSSPSVKMSPDTLKGAMTGVTDAANDALDNADRQRFGGQMRSRQQRGQAPAASTGGKISVTAPDGSVHPFDTQAQADRFKQLAGIK